MSWQALLTEARDSYTIVVVLGAVIAAAVLKSLASEDHKRHQILGALAIFHVLLVPVAAVLRSGGGEAYQAVRLVCLWFGSVAFVTQGGAVLFVGVLGSIKLRPPRLVEDLVVAGAAALVMLWVASSVGVHMSGLVATSAVLSAVVGLALQDTLGSLIGGVTLQFDNSIVVGDWVKIGGLTGRVTEIRWRYTAIETRDWETIVIPNNKLIKEQLLVLGRRSGEPEKWRRWISFNVDYRYSPTDVIAKIDEVLQAAPIDQVAQVPAPHALFMGFDDSYARYAARYWLTDLARDDPTDSIVRTRIYFALQRANIPFSIPAQAIFVTETSQERSQAKLLRFDAERMEALRAISLFRDLPEDDLRKLADSLVRAPFSAGETMTRQGAEAHWLYVLTKGEASVNVKTGDASREVGRIKACNFFGEMSLMTGTPRVATVVALTDVECWRLDRDAFREILQRRPQIAEKIAGVLAARQFSLDEARTEIQQTDGLDDAKSDMLQRIRRLFRLGG